MFFNTAHIFVSKEKMEVIRTKWLTKQIVSSSESENGILDHIPQLHVTLRVPVRVYRGEMEMSIPGVLLIQIEKDRVQMTLRCNLLKPLIILLFYGILISAILLAFHHFLLIVPVTICFIAALHFYFNFYIRIIRFCMKFMEKIDSEYVE